MGTATTTNGKLKQCHRCGQPLTGDGPVMHVRDELGEWWFVHIDCIDPEIDGERAESH